MTRYYIYNGCALSTNLSFDNTVNLESFRKGIYAELFLVFLIYFISQALHAFRYRNTEQKSLALRNNLKQSLSQNQDDRPDLPWHQKKWNRTFSVLFSNHCISLGMCILFSPLAGAIVMAYVHLIFFIIYVIGQLKMSPLIIKVCRLIIDIINLVLILIGLIGINYADTNSSGYCVSSYA